MGIESATFVSDFVTTNPLGGDQRSTSDDHHRLIKSVLQNSFPNASRAFRLPTVTSKTTAYTVILADDNSLILGDATGGAFTVTLISAPSTGFVVSVLKSDVSANAVTVDGAGADTINGAATLALANQYDNVMVMWDGTEWFIISDKVLQAAGLTDIAGLAVTDGNFIVGDGSNWVAESGSTARTSLGAAGLADANIFTLDQTLQDATNDALVGPLHILDRTRTGVAADRIGRQVFRGRNTTPVALDYAYIETEILDPTAGSADGRLHFRPITGDVYTDKMSLGPGLTLGAPTDGDKGLGTVNAENGLYDDGVLITDSLVRIESQVPTAVNAVDFTTGIDSTHASYVFFLEELQPVTDARLWVRVAIAGPTFQSTNYRYSTGRIEQGASYAWVNHAFATSGGEVVLAEIEATGTIGLSGRLDLHSPASTDIATMMEFHGVGTRAGANLSTWHADSIWNTTTAVIGVRFLWASSVNFVAQGRITLFGIKHT